MFWLSVGSQSHCLPLPIRHPKSQILSECPIKQSQRIKPLYVFNSFNPIFCSMRKQCACCFALIIKAHDCSFLETRTIKGRCRMPNVMVHIHNLSLEAFDSQILCYSP